MPQASDTAPSQPQPGPPETAGATNGATRPSPAASEAGTGAGAEGGKGADKRVTIKKYANRRLYNTASSTYVTLDHLAEMVRGGTDFVVYDAKTNDDITRQVLTQIIFEEESRGQNLLPVQFLRQLIRLYGDQMQSFVPSYLEASLDAFARQQERLGADFGKVGAAPGVNLWEEQVRANLALFDRAMKIFTPYGYRAPDPEPENAAPAPAPAPMPMPMPDRGDDLSDLKRRMEEMQAQLAKLATRA